MSRRVAFALFPGCEILDFAGPVQALHEANAVRSDSYRLSYVSSESSVTTAQGLRIGTLDALPVMQADDWVMVPGYPLRGRKVPGAIVKWVRRCADAGARICSVCTGAFVLGQAGLLNGRKCTTHWRRIAELHREFRGATVLGDQLFVADGDVVTSAGIAAGIDMTLWLIEQDLGPVVAAAVAREMVVYTRRGGTHRQSSVYLDYQRHLNPAIHALQHYLTENPASRETLAALGGRVGMSPRNLTRVFKQSTGISVHRYRSSIRLELARTLMNNPSLTLEAIAHQCGLRDARHLRRLLHSG